MPSYQDMEMKFGPAIADQCLTEIEKAARIPLEKVMTLDPETRLANALRAQDLYEAGVGSGLDRRFHAHGNVHSHACASWQRFCD